MKILLPCIFAAFLYSCSGKQETSGALKTGEEILIKLTQDFSLTGDGSADAWKNADWIQIPQRTNDSVNYNTRAKILYSESGLYFLFDCEDSLLTNSLLADRTSLYNEDVIEVFLWPDTARVAYFEYEISPLNYETPILVFNNSGDLNSWHPFEINAKRRILHQTSIISGEKKPYALAKGWVAEFFIPFDLLSPLTNKPQHGSRWKANLYRIDYDHGEALWTWKPNSGDFHEYQHFGFLQFD